MSPTVECMAQKLANLSKYLWKCKVRVWIYWFIQNSNPIYQADQMQSNTTRELTSSPADFSLLLSHGFGLVPVLSQIRLTYVSSQKH